MNLNLAPWLVWFLSLRIVSNKTVRLDVMGDGRSQIIADLDQGILDNSIHRTINLAPQSSPELSNEPQECPPCVCLLEDHFIHNQLSRNTPSRHLQDPTPKPSNFTPDTTLNSLTSSPIPEKTPKPARLENVVPLPPHTMESDPTTPTSSSTERPRSSSSEPSVSCPQSSSNPELCLSESCVMAAGTILSSLDKSVDPCDDFYQFSCGGWEQRSSSNSDRFQAIDRRNQNILHSILTQDKQENVSVAEEKAKTFYRSCIQDRQGVIAEDLNNLQTVIQFVGGWNVSGEYNVSMDIKERIFRLQNMLGVSALFTWGVVPENNTNHLAVVPGGWVEENLQESGTYIDLMVGIGFMLQEAAKCPPVEYVYDMDLELSDGESVNEIVEVDYEYRYDINAGDLPDLFSVFKQVFWPAAGPGLHNSTIPGVDLGSQPWEYGPYIHQDEEEEEEEKSRDSEEQYRREREDKENLNHEEHLNHEENIDHKDPEKNIHRTSREDCINRISKEVEETELNQRVDLELTMRSILYIEERLRNLSSGSPGHTHVKLKSMTMKELEEKFGFLDWSIFFSRSFEIIDHDLDQETRVLVDEPYLQGVSSLLAELDPTQIHNYLVWRLVVSFYPSKYSEEEKRKETCLKQTEDVFGPVITAMYVRDKTVESSRKVIQEVEMMVDIMKEAFSTNMDKMNWMSEHSRKAGKEKLSGMMDLIGYPDHVLNSTWLNQRYEEVDVSNDYLMNIIAFQSHERKEGMKLFIKTYERGSWVETSHGGSIVMVNAFYSPNSNTMIVPIGMLQDPLYWSQPKSLTFGAFGIVVAHEITHAFDDEGINYSHQGAMDQLYDNITLEAFHTQANCIREQYSRYSILDVSVDGNLTLTENLADHGGLKMALSAYSTWKQEHTDLKLPALPYSDTQLFFLGYALPWCSTHSESQNSHVMKDEHSPGRFRVEGPLSNSEEFAAAWNCPKGSRMNPIDKCTVW